MIKLQARCEQIGQLEHVEDDERGTGRELTAHKRCQKRSPAKAFAVNLQVVDPRHVEDQIDVIKYDHRVMP